MIMTTISTPDSKPIDLDDDETDDKNQEEKDEGENADIISEEIHPTEDGISYLGEVLQLTTVINVTRKQDRMNI